MTGINNFRELYSPYKQVSIAPLVMFRIIFGLLMIFGTTRFLLNGWVESLYIQPSFFFTYYGFDWVKPLSGYWMYLPFVLMLISALGITFAAFYRISTTLFFLAFTYVELLDKSNYLNHYYFVSLVAFIMIFVPANRFFSLDVRWKKTVAQPQVSRWSIDLLKFQLACVYVFAGIAKLHFDWLINAQPLSTWLQAHRDMPIFGSLLQEEWVAYVFSWFGCFYDLFIVFFLLWSKSRKIAYLFVVVFHLITWLLFPIGVFPWVMIFSTLIFFSTNFHQQALGLVSRIISSKINFENKTESTRSRNKLIPYFLIAYVSIQLLLPFRYALYPGNLFWNEEGFRFSWRVMLMHKDGLATFYVVDPETRGEIEIDNTDYLSEHQIDQMATQPDMILQYAHHLKSTFSDTTLHFGKNSFHLKNPEIRARVYVTLNGRKSQLFIDKKHDLSRIPYNLAHRNWLEAYAE